MTPDKSILEVDESVVNYLCHRYNTKIIPGTVTGFPKDGFVVFHPKTNRFLGVSIPLDLDGDPYNDPDIKGDWWWEYGREVRKYWSPAVFTELIDAITVAGWAYWSCRPCEIWKVKP